MKKAVFVFLVIAICLNKAQAQSNSNFQVWSDLNASIKLNEKLDFGGDIGYRIEPSSNDQTIYIRPILGYNASNILNFSFGGAIFNTFRSDIFNSSEFRAFQFVVLKWPKFGGFEFKHRFGLEQRFFYIENFDFDGFSHRMRYYLEVKTPSFELFNSKFLFFVMGNFELLTDLNKNEVVSLFDHNRITIGVGSQISEKIKVELRSKLISFVNPVLNSYVREIGVMRIRLYYQFD